MKSRARVLVLCLLCVARASIALPSEEITEFRARSAAHVQDLSNVSVQEINGITDEQAADKLRYKRALGLLLSGLAQIFGYTVTPIQIATLPNPNTTIPAAMSSLRPQVASSRPMNITAPRQRETIRFTGVLNFGNNSDILGHLQRYEQMFHGPRNNTTTTTLRPPPKPTPPPAQVTLDPRINPPTKPPLLAPFFVKIPLPIAPELLPAAIPEDLTLSYPAPAITIVGESNENAEPPIRKEQETVYKNEDSERKQEARRERLKEQEKHRNREKPTHCRDDETKERYKDREEEIDNRNRQHASKYKPTEKKRPTHNDEDEEGEDSAEKYEEREDEPKSSRGSSRRPPEKNDKDKVEDYPDRDGNDERSKQFSDNQQPENFDKYIEAAYNRQLPIGDYFHEGNPEVIRDSYGAVLDGKKLEDDKLAEFINMFKHPSTGVDASQEVHDPEDASGEDGKEAPSADGYNEHLARLQKLREEYAPPENKYEEYDLNDERKADRNDRKSERNRASAGSKKSKTGRVKQTIVGTENGRIKLPTVSGSEDGLRNDVRAEAQRDIEFGKYTPLIVPVRYIDINDKLQQATMQQLNYKKMNKLTNQSQSIQNHFPKIFPENTMESVVTTLQEKFSQQATFPEKIRQLHEGEYKELQVFPPPFDYAYDNTKPVNIIVPANLQIDPHNYQPIVKNNPNNDKSSEERSGYSVVIGDPVYPYRYPQNIYYYSNEATNPQNQASHLNAEGTHPQDQIYVPQQSGNQQFIQANPNLTEYNLNETAKNSYNYYYQPQEIPASVLDRYRYIFGEQAPQAEESSNIDVRSQIPNAENWSNRIYRPQTQSNAVEQSFSSLPQQQNVAASNYNMQSKSLERPQPRRQNSKPEEQQENNEKTEIPLRQSIPKSFDDPQTAHDFFGFSKDDYSFRDESDGGSTIAEENGKTAKESHVLVAPEPITAHYDDESIARHADELENNPEKTKVKEYRNRVATLRVSEQRQTRPNGPIHYVDYIRNI